MDKPLPVDKPLPRNIFPNAFGVLLRRLQRLRSNVPLPKQFSGSAPAFNLPALSETGDLHVRHRAPLRRFCWLLDNGNKVTYEFRHSSDEHISK